MGLDRDRGERLANGKYRFNRPDGTGGKHFVTADLPTTHDLDFGNEVDGIYSLGPETEVLAERDGSPRLATHAFGKGRSVYFSGFKFSHENTRLLHRALFWASGQESRWKDWNVSNVRTECAWFPQAGRLVVINNSGTKETTTVTLGDGSGRRTVRLEAHGIAILEP